jgi:RNA polymerase sigma-70 factor, ECF subfamily
MRKRDEKNVIGGKNNAAAEELADLTAGRNGDCIAELAKELSQAPGLDDRSALDALFIATYEELRGLARSVRRGDPSATLNPTALVNEAWIKMAKAPRAGATSRLHFKRIAARAMRQLLVEAARRRNADKRGGGEITVTFDPGVQKKQARGEDVLALNRALDALAEMNPRQALMVESRFFGGLDIPETAELLNVSEATVLRDWRVAKAWLAHELKEGRGKI